MAEKLTGPQAALDDPARCFFGAFTNKPGAPNVDVLHRLFLPQAVIIKRSGAACEVMTVINSSSRAGRC